MKKVKFNISGMTCSSCVSHVEKAVGKLQGISSVNVNLLLNNMIVEYDNKLSNNDAIIIAVRNAGYEAKIAEKVESVDKTKEDFEEGSIKKLKLKFIISLCFLIPLMYISMNSMLNHVFNIPTPAFIVSIFHGSKNAINFAFSQFLLLLPIMYLNRNYFIIGFKKLFRRAPNMDSLIALGSSAATIYGIISIFMIGYGFSISDFAIIETYSSNIYFESAGTILTLITLGKYLEAKSKGKTSDAISKLVKLAPKTALVIRKEKEIEIPIEEIVIGDILVIKPGLNIPVDGEIIEGVSIVDESAITGESVPVEKNIGDKVVSGTFNKNGVLKIKAVKIGQDTTLSQIIKLVEEASNSKAKISKIADKVSGVFVPVVIIISIITFIMWLLNGQTIATALSFAISVLVISCPCALGLATPVAIMVGTGVGAKNGILTKSAESLETLHLVDTVVLDKTGTITTGKPVVTDVISYIEVKEFLEIAGSLEKNSEHPLADAVIYEINKRNIKIDNVSDFRAIPGRGVQANIDSKTYYSGNLKFMQESEIDIKSVRKKGEELSNNGKTVLYFANNKEIIGMIAVADIIKSDSKQAVDELKKRKIDVVMITGDNNIVAQSIAKKVGITDVISEVLPKQKQDEVLKLKLNDKKVAFVGDGINDSPALVSADVGISVSSGTDIAIESADIILMRNSLLDVVTAIDLSKKVINNIKLNLFWAFAYNCICIPIAAGILYIPLGLKLSPMLGAAAMSFSSVCVVTNALRIKKFKNKFKEGNNMALNKKIYIDGMQCNHCKMSVEKALNTISNITKVEVNLDEKCADIEMISNIDNSEIINVIKEAGFEVKEIKD